MSGFMAAFSNFQGFWYNFTFALMIIAFLPAGLRERQGRQYSQEQIREEPRTAPAQEDL